MIRKPGFYSSSMLADRSLRKKVRAIRCSEFAASILAILAVAVVNGGAVEQEPESSPDNRLENATSSFREIMHEPDKGIPAGLFHKAHCIVIIPGVKKAAFIVGGKYGRGFVSCRANGTGRFGTPAPVRIEGGSYGLQIGGSSTDVFMLIMNEDGMKKLLADKFTIGGEAEAAAGPVGRDTSANTDVLLHAEILSWSRSRGLFAGISLDGSTLRPDGSEAEKLYGKKVTNEEILHGDLVTPTGARPLVAELNRYRSADLEASLDTKRRLTLSNVHFATGEAELSSDSASALNNIVAGLKEHPDWKIRVEGFTDNVGSPNANLKLSTERAHAVMDWLANHGIDRSRLSAKGYGESHPVAKNSSEEGRAKNRRVELVRT
jgi:SH3 domain-containing YSC84-like protein 1